MYLTQRHSNPFIKMQILFTILINIFDYVLNTFISN